MQLVKVRFILGPDELSDREYTYYSEKPLLLEDIVTVPVRDSFTKAQVTSLAVDEEEIAAFKDKIKIIPASPQVKPDNQEPLFAEPVEAKTPDAAMLTAIAKKHHDSKPVAGVRFFNKPGIRVSSR